MAAPNPFTKRKDAMSDFFNFLYDDEAPTPVEKVGDVVSTTVDAVRGAASEMFDSPTGKWTAGAAKVGLVAGAAVGTFVIVIGVATAIVSALTGKK